MSHFWSPFVCFFVSVNSSWSIIRSLREDIKEKRTYRVVEIGHIVEHNPYIVGPLQTVDFGAVLVDAGAVEDVVVGVDQTNSLDPVVELSRFVEILRVAGVVVY